MTWHDPAEAGPSVTGEVDTDDTTGARRPERPPRLSRRLDFCVAGTAVLDFVAGRERVLGRRPAVGPAHDRHLAVELADLSDEVGR